MIRPRTLAVLALALATVAGPALAADDSWKVDPNHSSAEFGIKHFALSTVKGTMPIIEGLVTIPEGKDIPSSVQATLDIGAIDTKQANRDKDLRSPNWFDVEKYPTVTFKSTKIEGSNPTKFSIVGELTMHGVTKPVTLEAHLEGKGVGGRGEKRVAYSAITTIHREDFGLSDTRANPIGALLVGKDADISLSIEATAQ